MSVLRLKNTRDIGALIRRRRKDMGIDQAKLAEKNGVSRAWLIKVERGHPNAQIGLVLRLLNYLDIPLSAGLNDASADSRGKGILDEVYSKTAGTMRVGNMLSENPRVGSAINKARIGSVIATRSKKTKKL